MVCRCFANLGRRLCAAWVLHALGRALPHGPCLLAVLLELVLLRLVETVKAAQAYLVHSVREQAIPEQAGLEELAAALGAPSP